MPGWLQVEYRDSVITKDAKMVSTAALSSARDINTFWAQRKNNWVAKYLVIPCGYCGEKKDLMAARVVAKEEVENNPAFAEFR